jgi:uncharacterized protein
MEDIIVYVEADVNPTEDAEKVKAAISNIVDNAAFTESSAYRGSLLKAEAKGQDSLVKLRNILSCDRIRDAARKKLYKSIRGNKIIFFLNKQVAFAGHVSFSEETAESPLGPLRVTIESTDPEQVVEWLAEKTD